MQSKKCLTCYYFTSNPTSYNNRDLVVTYKMWPTFIGTANNADKINAGIYPILMWPEQNWYTRLIHIQYSSMHLCND